MQVITVFIHGDIQHSKTVAGLGLNSLKQVDIPFYTGDQLRFSGLGQTQLQESAYAIGVAVKNIVVGHVVSKLITLM